MATVRKFMFDHDFGAPKPDPKALAEAAAAAEQIEEEEIVPTFSAEELEQAREEGRKAGHEAGRKEAAEATEQMLLTTLDNVVSRLADIYSAQEMANQEIAKEMVSIAVGISRKVFPDLSARNALGEVERVVLETLKAISEEPRVQILAPPDMRELILERLPVVTARAGFEGKVFVSPDPGLNPGDCRVEWSNGAAVRDTELMWEMIDEIVQRNIYGEDYDADSESAPALSDPSPVAPMPMPPDEDLLGAPRPEPAAASAAEESPAASAEDAMADAGESAMHTAEPAPLDAPEIDMDQSLSDDPEVPQPTDEMTAPPAEPLDAAAPSAVDEMPEGTDAAPGDMAGPALSPVPVSPETQAAILSAQSDMTDDTADAEAPVVAGGDAFADADIDEVDIDATDAEEGEPHG